MVLFQYGVALHELETERIRAGEISLADKRETLEGIWRKTRRQLLKDYVAFPLLAGRLRRWSSPATCRPT
ncbi:putative linoleoyl-CoA desaturase [Mycobacterium xenopi 3993]|nr:putative linoleoyl-CoA desaturase [Mycobacterium xenopi 3993]